MKQINVDVSQKSNNSKVPKNLSSLPQTSGEQSQGRFFVDINGKSYFITLKQLITLAQIGVVVLDSTGRVPQSLLPSYVDDVIEYENKSAFPTIGESGKIYIDLKTNLSYRWGGTTYVEISPSLALGETDSTAYAGNKGKQNAENIKSLQDRMGIAETDISNVKSDARKAKEWVEGVGTSIANWFGDAIETTDNFNDALQQKVMGVAWDFPEKITAHVDVYTQFTFEFESNGEKFKRISYNNWELKFVEEKSGTPITVYPSDDWYKYRRIYTDDLNVSLEAIGATKDDTVTIGDRLSNGFQGIRNGLDDAKTNFENGINTLNSNFNSLVSRITGVAWELKDITKTVLPNKPIIHEFEFISNGIKFNRMRYYNYNAPAQDCNLAYRRSDDGEEIIVYEYTQGNSIWQNEAYKTVITDDIDVSLEDIGAEINFELSIVERLGEKSKTVLGAIENLFDVEEIGNDIKGWLEGIDDSISKFGSFVVDKIKSVGKTLFGSKEEVEQNTTAISETQTNIGDMSQLEIGGATTFNLRATRQQTTLVDAINNVHYRTRALEEIPFLTATNNNLETTSKEIVGAINEVNKKTVDKIDHIDTYTDGYADRLSTEDGIEWEEGFKISVLGGLNREGRIYHRIPLVAGENINFTVKGDLVKINATGGSSSDSAIGTWVLNDFNLSQAGNLMVSPISLEFSCDGVTYYEIGVNQTGPTSWYWYDFVFRTDGSDTTASVFYVNKNGVTGDNGWYDTKFKTIQITKEPSEGAKAWLGYYATKQEDSGASNGLEMPQIRFAGMPCDGWFGDIDFYLGEGMDGGIRNQCNLKFTIEIVGGGALQIGDTIQICRVKSYGPSSSMRNGMVKYHPKKKKLRKYVEYTITEEDLDKRFITFEVQWNDEKARRLFGRTSTNVSGLSPLYFRIRRPKGDTFTNRAGKEYTSNAEFSNVVTVWKTCHAGAWRDPDTEEQIDYYNINLV